MIALCALAVPSMVATGERDYALDHSGWNGLSEWCALAREMGLSVESATTLDLDALDPTVSTLVVLSPLSPPDPAPMLRLLRRGGRLLLADDYGRSDSLWTALEMSRAESPATPVAEVYRDNPRLPIARPSSGGPLTDGVDRVVTNHPAVIRSRLPAALQFSSPIDAVAVAAELPADQGGSGRFVALSDPSVLINNMLAFEGNLAFARNLLGWLARPGGRLVIMTGDIELRGGGLDGSASGRRGWADLRREFNAFCAGLSSMVPSRTALHGMGIVLCGALVAALLPALRLPRRRPGGPFGAAR